MVCPRFLSRADDYGRAPLGQPIAGMWTWDLMRLVDVVAARAEVDPHRIGCAGLSVSQTLYLVTIDPRIQRRR